MPPIVPSPARLFEIAPKSIFNFLDIVVCATRRVSLAPMNADNSSPFLKTIEIKGLHTTPCHTVGELVQQGVLPCSGKPTKFANSQPSKLKGPGTSTSFLHRSLRVVAHVSKQVQWDGVEARLRHTEGVPRAHEIRGCSLVFEIVPRVVGVFVFGAYGSQQDNMT